MGIVDEVGSILKQYQGGKAPAPADVNAHFDQVAAAVPQGELADGVAHALRVRPGRPRSVRSSARCSATPTADRKRRWSIT